MMTQNEALTITAIFAVVIVVIVAKERLRWVTAERLKLLESHSSDFFALPSRWSMFWRFWIWDVDRFMY